MSKQPYYTDPLAAAWMAKHFGMRFNSMMSATYGVEAKPQFDGAHCYWMELQHPAPLGFRGDRLHIHPDSLHLLDAKEGDWVEYKFVEQGGGHIEVLQFNDMWPELGLNKIFIQCINKRNDKPFFWPETEAALSQLTQGTEEV